MIGRKKSVLRRHAVEVFPELVNDPILGYQRYFVREYGSVTVTSVVGVVATLISKYTTSCIAARVDVTTRQT